MANVTKLTPERQTVIRTAIRHGSTYKLAAQAAGVAYETFNDWVNKGKDPEGAEVYVHFLHDIKKAEAELADECLQNILRAANESKNWTASAWMLERRYQDQYSKDSWAYQESHSIKEMLSQLIKEKNHG